MRREIYPRVAPDTLSWLSRNRPGNPRDMTTDVEIERSLAAITATLNDQQFDGFDAGRVQEIVDEALGGERKLTVDDGGGLHDESGARVGAVPPPPHRAAGAPALLVRAVRARRGDRSADRRRHSPSARALSASRSAFPPVRRR